MALSSTPTWTAARAAGTVTTMNFAVTRNGEPIGSIAWKPLIIILGSVGIFGVALPRLGLIVTIPLLIALSSFAAGKFRPVEIGLLSVVLTVGSYLVFVTGLGLVIPVWPSFLG